MGCTTRTTFNFVGGIARARGGAPLRLCFCAAKAAWRSLAAARKEAASNCPPPACCETCATRSIEARGGISAFVSSVLLRPPPAMMSCRSFLFAVDMREKRLGSLSGAFNAGDTLRFEMADVAFVGTVSSESVLLLPPSSPIDSIEGCSANADGGGGERAFSAASELRRLAC